MNTDYTLDELLCVCIAAQIHDGEWVAQGISTPLVQAALILAQQTHAPHTRFISAIGQSVCRAWDGQRLSVSRAEDYWLGAGLLSVGFVGAAVDLLPTYQPKEFFRPAQVDAHGNFNNLAIPKPHMRLPGSGGIPDVTVIEEQVCLYVPRHAKAIFVPRVAHISGLGHSAARTHGRGPLYCVTDLGQFDWDADGLMRLTHLHPHATVEQVQARTGFPVRIANPLAISRPPSAHELVLLREHIDPLGVRLLELLSGPARRQHLRQMLLAEGSYPQ
jgi:glutaconate CoA-transferase, subunit B